MKPPQKSLKYSVLRASRLVNISMCQEGAAPQLHRDRSSCAQDPFRPHPMYLFTWLFICILYYILYNKLVNASVFLNSVSHFSILSNLNRRSWELQLTASWSEVQATVWDLQLASEVGQSCRTEPLICGLQKIVSELNGTVGRPAGVTEWVGVGRNRASGVSSN